MYWLKARVRQYQMKYPIQVEMGPEDLELQLFRGYLRLSIPQSLPNSQNPT